MHWLPPKIFFSKVQFSDAADPPNSSPAMIFVQTYTFHLNIDEIIFLFETKMRRSRTIIVKSGFGNAISIAISHKTSLLSHKAVSIVFSSMELCTHQRSVFPRVSFCYYLFIGELKLGGGALFLAVRKTLKNVTKTALPLGLHWSIKGLIGIILMHIIMKSKSMLKYNHFQLKISTNNY